jgi:bacillithiol system protein YtxJ
MHWNKLEDKIQLEKIKEESQSQSVLIFKHSTRCSISSMSLNRLDRKWNDNEMKALKPYYLDLIQYRDISNLITSEFGVAHQSPQVLVMENGEIVYSKSHFGINYSELKERFQG